MELRHLRYFVAVAEHESFSKAARLLYVSQSSLSEQIADLEEEIGVPLLQRGSRRSIPTEAGKIFFKHAHKILEEVQKATFEAQRVDRGEMGTLRIGFFAGGVGDGFLQMIRSFRTQYPGIELSLVEMTSTQQWQALVEGRIDIAFSRVPEPPYQKILKYETLQLDPIVAILPKEHPRARDTRIDLHDLAKERFVISSRETSPAVYDKVIELCAEAGFSPQIASVSTVWSSVILMVQAGEGIALLPLNQQQARMRSLAFVPLLSKEAFVEFCMCWPARRDTPLLSAFRALVREHAKHSSRL